MNYTLGKDWNASEPGAKRDDKTTLDIVAITRDDITSHVIVMMDPNLLVLASLADGDKHGYAMMEDIRAFADVSLGPGTLATGCPNGRNRFNIRPGSMRGGGLNK
jgi:hypothetical protein